MPENPKGSVPRVRWTWWVSAGRIAIIYVVVGGVWILVSGAVARRIAPSEDVLARIESVKGYVFVLVTGLGLFWLVSRALRAREKTNKELAESRERYELAIGGTNDAIWDWDIVRDSTHRSPRYEMLLGYAPGELAPEQFKWEERVHPEDLARAKAAQMGHLRGDERYDVEYRLRMKDGSYRWFRARGKANRDAQGRPVRMAGSIADIHERVESRNRLRESEERYRQIVETADEGIWVVDAAWRTTFANARIAEMLGVTPEEMFGRHLFEFMDEKAQQDCQRNMQRREQGVREQHDFRFRRKDGTDLWAIVSTNAILDGAGRFVGALAMVTDVTQRAGAERLNEGQRRVLEIIATGAPMERTVDAIVEMIQQQAAPAIASVLRLDEQRTMRTVAAPLLPAAYNTAVDGGVIGSGVGSCGTAMAEKRRVVVTDIATDPLWVAYREVALAHGLRACWSEPIIASDGTVLGSLAMYFKETRGPTARDIGVITTAAHLAGIAMERARTEQARERSEATNRALLAANPDMMFRMDRAGRYVGYHAPDPARLAAPPEKFMGRTMEEVLPAEWAAECRAHLEKLFATGEPQMYEYQAARPRGMGGWWEVRMVQGMQGEALLLLRDVTDRVVAERRVRESEQRLRLLVESTPLGVVYWDTEFRVTGWNAAAEKMFGYSAEEASGKHAGFIIPEASRRYVNDILRELLSKTGGFRASNQNLKKDGTLVYCEWYNSPLVDQSGRVIGVASVVEDVTESRLTQQRQDFMMAELDHRVKNNLAAVISLAEQTGRGSTDYKQFLETFMGRVRAMSRMHSVLARSRWKGADLRTLVTQTLEAFGSGSAGKTSVVGESVMIGPRAAQAMAMALNELATNAMKYGALSNATGSVHVSWTMATQKAERQVSVRWEERGGPRVTPPERRGFGTQLIEGTIAYELRGTVRTEYAPSGVVCKMVVPLIEEIGPIEEEPGSGTEHSH